MKAPEQSLAQRIRIAILLCAVFALTLPVRAQSDALPKLVKVQDNLYVIENVNANLEEIIKYGGNILVYLTGDGVILVDSKNAGMHDDVVAKVRSLTDQPIKYVVVTHNHGDHSGGAEKMAAMGATVIMSSNARDNFARAPGQTWLPPVGFSGEAELSLGGKKVEIHEVRGHTRGDAVVYFPAERIAAGGDLFATSPELPFIVNYADGGSWVDLSHAIDELLELDFDYLIPGHGPRITKAQVVAIRDRVVAIRERFRALVRENKSPEEIAQTLMKEHNWGVGPAAGNIPGMMQELR